MKLLSPLAVENVANILLFTEQYIDRRVLDGLRKMSFSR